MGLTIELDFRCNECGADLDSYQRGDTIDIEPCHSCLEDKINKIEELEDDVKDLEESNHDLEEERDGLDDKVISLETQIVVLNEIIIQMKGKEG